MNALRRFLYGAMMVLTVFVLCRAGFAAEKAVTLKLANYGSADPGDRTVIAVEVFRKYVEARTGGSIRFDVTHGSQPGGEKEILEGLKTGTIELGAITTGPIRELFKPIMVFDIPYLFPNKYVAWEVLDGPFGQRLMDEMLKVMGVRSLAISEKGYIHFFAGEKVIRSPEDMKELKIRTVENPANMKFVEAFGAIPTPIAFGELYMALRQGVVDGAECSIALINDMKFYEVGKNVVLDGHIYTPLILFVNDEAWKKLSADQQQVLFEGAQFFKITQRALTERQVQAGFDSLVTNGMVVYVPTEEEKEQFRILSQPAVLDYVKEQAGQEWVDGVLRAVQEASQKEQALLD